MRRSGELEKEWRRCQPRLTTVSRLPILSPCQYDISAYGAPEVSTFEPNIPWSRSILRKNCSCLSLALLPSPRAPHLPKASGQRPVRDQDSGSSSARHGACLQPPMYGISPYIYTTEMSGCTGSAPICLPIKREEQWTGIHCGLGIIREDRLGPRVSASVSIPIMDFSASLIESAPNLISV